MSSTNKTTNYNLSQYIGSDKPTYLSDYNGDMLKIDTQMKTNADNIATAISGVETVTTTATTANTTANTALTNANTAIAGNATTQNQLTAFKNMFNLSSIKTYGVNDISTSASPVAIDSVGFCDITLAKDSTGSIFKLYGEIRCFPHNSGSVEITLPNTGLTVPDSDYYISPAGISDFPNISGRWVMLHVENNKMTLQWFQEPGNVATNTILFPCIYFNTDFGDSGQSNE